MNESFRQINWFSEKLDSNESFATWNNLQQTTSSLFVTYILASENSK